MATWVVGSEHVMYRENDPAHPGYPMFIWIGDKLEKLRFYDLNYATVTRWPALSSKETVAAHLARVAMEMGVKGLDAPHAAGRAVVGAGFRSHHRVGRIPLYAPNNSSNTIYQFNTWDVSMVYIADRKHIPHFVSHVGNQYAMVEPQNRARRDDKSGAFVKQVQLYVDTAQDNRAHEFKALYGDDAAGAYAVAVAWASYVSADPLQRPAREFYSNKEDGLPPAGPSLPPLSAPRITRSKVPNRYFLGHGEKAPPSALAQPTPKDKSPPASMSLLAPEAAPTIPDLETKWRMNGWCSAMAAMKLETMDYYKAFVVGSEVRLGHDEQYGNSMFGWTMIPPRHGVSHKLSRFAFWDMRYQYTLADHLGDQDITSADFKLKVHRKLGMFRKARQAERPNLDGAICTDIAEVSAAVQELTHVSQKYGDGVDVFDARSMSGAYRVGGFHKMETDTWVAYISYNAKNEGQELLRFVDYVYSRESCFNKELCRDGGSYYK